MEGKEGCPGPRRCKNFAGSEPRAAISVQLADLRPSTLLTSVGGIAVKRVGGSPKLIHPGTDAAARRANRWLQVIVK